MPTLKKERKPKDKHYQFGKYHVWAPSREEAKAKLRKHLGI